MAATTELQLGAFVEALSAKQPTPGGGAAAAIGAAIAAAAAEMAANYTQRKKDIESGAAASAQELIAKLQSQSLFAMADADAAAYADLQRSWKDSNMTAEEKSTIEATALQVPVSLMEYCVTSIKAIKEFLPSCNPNITSDAKVGIHQLAGSARAAYQTALVNSPTLEVREKLRGILHEIRTIEDELLLEE